MIRVAVSLCIKDMEIVVIALIATLFFASTLGITLFVGIVTGLWYSKYYYDRSEATGTRRWPVLQRWLAVNVFHYVKRHYFNYTIVFKGSADLGEKVARCQGGGETAIFACSPHGLFAIGSFFLVGVPDYHTQTGLRWKRVRACTHRHVFAIPGLREIALWLGAINADRVNIEKMLERESIMLAPGGTREMIIDKDQPIQSVHKGFLKIAFAMRKRVFPVIHTGQEDVFPSYSCAPLDRLRRVVLNLTGYPFPTFFIGPLPRQLTTYIFDAHDPVDYTNEETFINAYYEKILHYNETL